MMIEQMLKHHIVATIDREKRKVVLGGVVCSNEQTEERNKKTSADYINNRWKKAVQRAE